MLREQVTSAISHSARTVVPSLHGSARHQRELVWRQQPTLANYSKWCWRLSRGLALAAGEALLGEKPEGGEGRLVSGAVDSARKDLPEARPRAWPLQ